jgi:hypothetical protein
MDSSGKKEAIELEPMLEHTSDNPIVDPSNGTAPIKRRKKESNVVAARLILLFYSSDASWQRCQFWH